MNAIMNSAYNFVTFITLKRFLGNFLDIKL